MFLACDAASGFRTSVPRLTPTPLAWRPRLAFRAYSVPVGCASALWKHLVSYTFRHERVVLSMATPEGAAHLKQTTYRVTTVEFARGHLSNNHWQSVDVADLFF